MQQNRKIVNLIFLLIFMLNLSCIAGKIKYKKADLVNIKAICPDIIVKLNFYNPNNILGKRIYPKNVAYVRGELADKLIKISSYLKKKGYRLKIWEAYRPYSVQKMMYEKFKNSNWISNPKYGKKTHNRGTAIDCTITDLNGKELEMPTKYLDFKNHDKMRSNSKNISEKAKKNRDFLIKTMKKFGLENYKGEWWHFQLKDWYKYRIITKDMQIFYINKDVIPRKELYK